MARRRQFIAGSAALVAAALSARGFGQDATDSNEQFNFGWSPDLPDLEDELLSDFPALGLPPPPIVDLSPAFPAPYNQGQVGSCTANAIAGAVQYARRAAKRDNDWIPSRTFIYYYERQLEGRVFTDSGAQLRNGIKVIVDRGVPPEGDWPYDKAPANRTTLQFTDGTANVTEPPADVQKIAKGFQTISYSKLSNDVDQLKNVLASGFPFFFGFRVYPSFTPLTKRLSLPSVGEKPTPSGHAILAVGYDDTRGTFKIRNSWGKNVHNSGYFEMDYDFVANANICRDFWVIYTTEAIRLPNALPPNTK